MRTDVLVVGAGFAGCVVAERLATNGKRVILVEKRPHIGGNSYDEFDTHGVLIHRYGPHIFHTNDASVFDYLSRFTEWRPYEHRVLSFVDGKLLPFPINLDTLNRFFNLNLDEQEAKAFLCSKRVPLTHIKNSEDLVLNQVGHELCDAFFRGYTRKQWGVDLSELDFHVASRIPVRTDRDERYFADTFQFMPRDGFTRMFERMLSHPRIEVMLNADFFKLRDQLCTKHIVYTGPIDAFFDFQFGRLPYRALRFEHFHLPNTPQSQPVGVINYPNDFEYTRITEFKHLTGQTHLGTSIVREYPCSGGEPSYPVPNSKNNVLFDRYWRMAAKEPDVTFLGRLAEYRYYNMDQTVLAGLRAHEKILRLT
jgi:UDP-galactopyranose mutase